MKLIVGLGNPEVKHLNNRHNVGFKVIDALNAAFKTQFKRKPASSQKFLQSTVWNYCPFVVLAKPMKYMNDSGVAVKKLVDNYKVDPGDVYIIHDDLDIPLGEYKIQVGKGPKVHNGVNSVIQELGTNKFGRIRVGIENRPSGAKAMKGAEYVLCDFTEEEKRIINWTIQRLTHDKFFQDLRFVEKV